MFIAMRLTYASFFGNFCVYATTATQRVFHDNPAMTGCGRKDHKSPLYPPLENRR